MFGERMSRSIVLNDTCSRIKMRILSASFLLTIFFIVFITGCTSKLGKNDISISYVGYNDVNSNSPDCLDTDANCQLKVVVVFSQNILVEGDAKLREPIKCFYEFDLKRYPEDNREFFTPEETPWIIWIDTSGYNHVIEVCCGLDIPSNKADEVCTQYVM